MMASHNKHVRDDVPPTTWALYGIKIKGNIMHKKFKLTIDEMIYPRYKATELLGNIKKFYIWMYVLIAVASLMMFVIGNIHWIICLFVFIGLSINHQLTYRKNFQKLIKKQLIKALKSNEAVDAELKIDEDKITFTNSGQSASFKWESIIKVADHSEFIEFLLEPTGVAIVYKRIFEESTELEEFQNLISSKLPKLYPIKQDI